MRTLIFGLIIVVLIVGTIILFGETVSAPTHEPPTNQSTSTDQSSSTELIDQNNNEIDDNNPPPIYIHPPVPADFDDINATTATPPMISKNCVIGGCSGQLCVSASRRDIITTCEWREEYACYQSARCEQQTNGECGWTETNELRACLANAI